ncbi:heterokaryon incompatibility protein-domain-containing protein [Xylariaceae sp. FL0804]|nr:heterokaryon incompatibility protein-domain-containing protein [Xylariaceae sp. FL0804]
MDSPEQTPAVFHYRPLLPGEIRLLCVEQDGQTTITARLEHVTIESTPAYWALSYAWGVMPQDQHIILDDSPLFVTRHLLDGLVRFRDTILKSQSEEHGGASLLWVDAICINQLDDDEKSVQIPMMGAIYSNCHSVLTWLGTASLGEQEAFAELVQIFEETQQESPDLRYLVSRAGAEPLRETYEEIHASVPPGERRRGVATALHFVGERTWFDRLWAAQEVALAPRRDPTVLLDSCVATYNILCYLTLSLRKWDSSHQRLLAFAEFAWAVQEPEVGIPGADESNTRCAWHLIQSLSGAVGLQATNPQDYIYGVLGLVPEGTLPTELRPKYSEPYQVVYHRYATFLISSLRSLHCLQYGRLGMLQGVPSWVPDLRYPDQENKYSHHPTDTFDRRKHITMPLVTISDNDSVMNTYGVKLGRCFPPSAILSRYMPADPQDTLAGHGTLSSTAMSTTAVGYQEFCIGLTRHFERSYSDLPKERPDKPDRGWLLKLGCMLLTGTPEDEAYMWDRDTGSRALSAIRDLVTKWRNNDYILLETGELASIYGGRQTGHLDLAPEDVVCQLPDVEFATFLRPTGDGKYKTVASAFFCVDNTDTFGENLFEVNQRRQQAIWDSAEGRDTALDVIRLQIV